MKLTMSFEGLRASRTCLSRSVTVILFRSLDKIGTMKRK